MRTDIEEFCQALETKIKNAYEESITVEEAEKLAAEFLHAQMIITKELQRASLDARMRRQGLKAIKAAVYLEGAKQGEKKRSDVLLSAEVDRDEIVAAEQIAFDEAEVEAEALQNYFRIFESSHVYFRNVAKGTFNG